MSTAIIEVFPDDGTALVAETRVKLINDEHKAAQQSQRSAVEHAVRCGQLLVGAKKSVAHGEWYAWVQQNLKFSERTAQGYMRLACIDLQKRNAVADLSLREALKAIADQTRKQQRLERAAEREAKVHEGVVTHVEREAPTPAPANPIKSVGVIDDEPKHDPSKLPKKLPPPSDGLMYSQMAISQLRRIANDDVELDAALDAVLAYITERRAQP